MPELFGSDAYAPKEIALKVETVGVAKAHMATLPLVMLGLLAGAFIGLGGLFFVIVKSDASLSFAVSQLLGGFVFCLGLFLVVFAGAELFTGNNLLAPPMSPSLAAALVAGFADGADVAGTDHYTDLSYPLDEYEDESE